MYHQHLSYSDLNQGADESYTWSDNEEASQSGEDEESVPIIIPCKQNNRLGKNSKENQQSDKDGKDGKNSDDDSLFSLSTRQLLGVMVAVQLVILVCVAYYGFKTICMEEQQEGMTSFWSYIKSEKHLAMLKSFFVDI